MKKTSNRLSRRLVLAYGATSSVVALTSSRASASYVAAFRHDGPVPAARGAWNDKFVCAESAGSDPLVADRSAIGAWEELEIIAVTSVLFKMKAVINGKFVSPIPGLGYKLRASGTHNNNAWHWFKAETSGLSGGHFRLIHDNTNKYVTLDTQAKLVADGTHYSAAGIFVQHFV